MIDTPASERGRNRDANKLRPNDQSVHNWYRFVLSFPPHLVRHYLERFGVRQDHVLLDPFCGAGTLLVEAKKHGIRSVGVEAHPMAFFASHVKVDWQPHPEDLQAHAAWIAEEAGSRIRAKGIEDLSGTKPGAETTLQVRKNGRGGRRKGQALSTLPSEKMALLLEHSISPLALHKTLVLLECLEQHRDPRFLAHERLALAKAVVESASNLQFGPEVGVGRHKPHAPVIAPWLANVESMASDLRGVAALKDTPAHVVHADARRIGEVLEPASIDVIFTSPPYPNEKDYTRTTRLESVLLGFIRSKDELRAMKQGLLRSNTRNVYVGDDDDEWVSAFPEVQRIADEIEARRIALGKTSGFERLYARATKLYFGGMARHLADLRPILRPGAHLAYVVGDQASYLRVHIPTGRLLGEIGQYLGYELEGIDLFRTRLATATRAQLREEVVVFRWPG